MEFDFTIGPGVHKSVTSSGDPKDVTETETSTGWVLPMRVFGDFAYNLECSRTRRCGSRLR